MKSFIFAIAISTAAFTSNTAVNEQTVNVSQAIDCIRNHHLDSPEGRTFFLVEKMQPLVELAAALNQEVQELFGQVNTSPKGEALALLTGKLQEKIEILQKMAPVLDAAKTLDVDLERVDALLVAPLPLTTDDEAILLRLNQICVDLDGLHS